MIKRFQFNISGRVQGVGFRPVVFRYSVAHGLSGFVKNTPSGVVIEVEGEETSIFDFISCLKHKPPEQSRIEAITFQDIPVEKTGKQAKKFEIMASLRSGDLSAGMPPDLAICSECRSELFDPADRRYLYPFINCVNCGPRFSIIKALPYDRAHTSMAEFQLCSECEQEYGDPTNRRFDAQPNACSVCGPSIELKTGFNGLISPSRTDPFEAAAELLRSGAVLAVKGVGGYHLCCDALNDEAVTTVRTRKNRPHKPLAVMFADLESARFHFEINDLEAAELSGCAAPIVGLRRKQIKSGNVKMLSSLISPDTRDVGVFLPYTPVHQLLLNEISPLVMTSGNVADEPIAKDELELRGLLESLADAALVHNRPIVRRCDDSVLKIVEGERLVLRRSRGFVPDAVQLPFEGPPTLACGADIKNAVCVTRGAQAFVSPHIGDLEDLRAYRYFVETIHDFSELLKVSPIVIAHDAHPDYHSTRYALDPNEVLSLTGVASEKIKRLAVQHHHAHIASCMAENGIMGPVIGVALDGTGFGPDGTVWGGEFLVADFKSFRRVAHFNQYPMPGGERAVLEPARMALSCLLAALGSDFESVSRALLPSLADDKRIKLIAMIERRLFSPLTSSAGRLFDAVAALLGMSEPVSYEGRAAVLLQAMAGVDDTSLYPFKLEVRDKMIIVSFNSMIRELVLDIESGVNRSCMADKFHNTIAEASAKTCSKIREREGLEGVALSGGVFQNELLLVRLRNRLLSEGFKVYTHSIVPPNDGGISLGQAAVAAAVGADT